jgi:putative phosphoserine phosphatase / 1-acylglycerol-3-phosphate O-acyltransferase
VLWGTDTVAAVRAFAAERGIHLARSVAYAGDEGTAVLHIVGYPRPTSPEPALARVAEMRGWP